MTDGIFNRCRSAVERGGGHHDEITLVPPSEELPRLMGALSNVSAGLSVIGVADEHRWRLLVKCALDGIHSLRRRVLEVLVEAKADLTTSTVGGRCGLTHTTARRHLEDLTALGVLDRREQGPERWAVSAWLRERWWAT